MSVDRYIETLTLADQNLVLRRPRGVRTALEANSFHLPGTAIPCSRSWGERPTITSPSSCSAEGHC